MSQRSCPKCHTLQIRRVKQQGLLQKLILQKLGYFPWECRFCKATFIRRERGHHSESTRLKVQTKRPVPAPDGHGITAD